MPTPLSEIQLVAFDVDGVLTDGRVYVDEEGRERHAFYIRDGMAIALAAKRGPVLAAISGRPAPGVRARLTQLRMTEIHLGIDDKAACLRDIATRHHVELRHCLFIGDDINDVPVMQLCGHSLAPADAHSSAREVATRIAQAPGGAGVLRELLDALWQARHEANGLAS